MIIINKEKIKKEGEKVEEVLLSLIISMKKSPIDVFYDMIDSNKIMEMNDSSYRVSKPFEDKVNTILLSSDDSIPDKDSIEELVATMRLMFPQGKKLSTSSYWRSNNREVILTLQKFFSIYGKGYTNDDLLNATKRYVSSFDGDYTFMRTICNFILKDDGDKVISDLATYLDNDSDENIDNKEWYSKLK